MKRRRQQRARWVAALAAALAGCAAPPDGAPPPGPAPIGLTASDRFFAAPADAPQPGPADQRWWQRFDDPALGDWVERALAANLDLQLAQVRGEEARAQLRAAMAARSLLLSAEARIDAGNRAGASGRRVEPSASLRLEWDADLWGARRWVERSAAAELLRAEHLAQAARLSTAALAARAYLAWREALRAERDLAAATTLQRDITGLVQVRVDAGLAPKLDGLRARGELAATEAAAVAAADAVGMAARALQLLAAGRPGAPLPALDAAAPMPGLQNRTPVTLPIDLLRLRPDLRAAEQALRAAEAERSAADAARRPSLRLPGALTLGSAAGGALLGQLSASIAAALSAPLFDGGRLEAERDAAQARVRAAELVYQRTLLQALAEVEAAFAAAAAAQARIAAQQRALAEAEAAIGQSRTLYAAGLAGFGDVLDAQRSALVRRQALLRMEGDAARASVATFEALGLIDAPARAP